MAEREGELQLRSNYFGSEPNGQKTDGTWYLDLTANYPVRRHRHVTLLGHVGISTSSTTAAATSKASYTDWKLGVSYVVPEGFVKGVDIGAYYTGNNAKEAFYTDLTGYNTAKDAGVVYVKKTF